MIALEMEQKSQEWFEARRGIPTASCFEKIVTSKGEPSKQAEKYMHQLAGELVSGGCDESFQSAAMKRGSELEAEARAFYELTQEVTVRQVGVCYPDEARKFACSPDGLVGEDGMVQFKCPNMATHVGYLIDGALPTDYFQQVQGELLVTGRKWLDFVSYYPGLKPLIVRVHRNEAFISKLKAALDTFCNDLEKVVQKIQ